jgi:hypothetical protein
MAQAAVMEFEADDNLVQVQALSAAITRHHESLEAVLEHYNPWEGRAKFTIYIYLRGESRRYQWEYERDYFKNMILWPLDERLDRLNVENSEITWYGGFE